MKLTLTRNRSTADATFGELAIDGVKECYTMERTAVMIPEGTYPIEFTFSPHFNRLMPLLDNVPQRSDIRLHPANFPAQLEGCIALGNSIDGDALDNSRDAFDRLFYKIIDQSSLTIEILSSVA